MLSPSMLNGYEITPSQQCLRKTTDEQYAINRLGNFKFTAD